MGTYGSPTGFEKPLPEWARQFNLWAMDRDSLVTVASAIKRLPK